MPINSFQLYLTDELFQFLVTKTKRYTSQFIAECKANNGSDDSYLVRYFGRCYNCRDEMIHWITYRNGDCSSELHNMPIFSKVVPRTHFQLLLKFLHFNSNDLYDPKDENQDRLCKL